MRAPQRAPLQVGSESSCSQRRSRRGEGSPQCCLPRLHSPPWAIAAARPQALGPWHRPGPPWVRSGPSLWPGALYLLMSRIITYLHTLFITYTYSLSLYLASLPSLCLAGALYLLMSRVISHAGRGRDRGQKQERGETPPSECIGVLGSRVYGLWPRV